MSEKSHIEWTESTWNPVTGCTKISAGCKHCYAEAFAERWRGIKGHPYEQGFDLRLWPERLALPLRWKAPRMIFVNSMSDLFHKDVPDDFIRRTFDVMIQARQHIFQILTKRSQRFAEWSNKYFTRKGVQEPGKKEWPENVWAGVSVENQGCVWRIKDLQLVPASIRFLSLEPLLGPIEFSPGVSKGIHWVIVGGESGFGARRMEPAWARSLRQQARSQRIAFFFKQWGAFNERGELVGKGRAGRRLDGRTWDELPIRLDERTKQYSNNGWNGRDGKTEQQSDFNLRNSGAFLFAQAPRLRKLGAVLNSPA